METAKPSKNGDTFDLTPSNGHNEFQRNADIDQAYLASKGLAKFFHSVLFQVILFGCISFVGPSIFDAISNLGGGGLSTPYLANLATTLNYVSGFLVTLFGGPLINKIGIKWSSFIATLAFPLVGSGYYTSARYGVEWYLLVATTVNGLTSGFLYVSSTTAMQTYPDQKDRGWYLGLWQAMMNSGAVIGGIINFVANYRRSDAGGVVWFTYLIFVGLECTGFIWALLLSPTKNVRRKDGTRPDLSSSGRNITWKAEFEALWAHARQSTSWLFFVPAFYSFFFGGTLGTYLTLHFSVRARALSSMVTPMCTIPSVIVYGKLLDMQRWSQKTRAWITLCSWVIPQAACFVWLGIEYYKFGSSSSAGLDPAVDAWRWAEAYLPFLIMFTTGYWTQLSLYWIIGTFTKDVKSTARSSGLFRAFTTCGMAMSYGINSSASVDRLIPLCLNAGLIILAIPCMVALIRLVPEQACKSLENNDEGASTEC
ncbi:major facilitator superfamily domain-containing protein [Colletotrichum cereale]|nr:major facilitator superfamily domain-containing protein [Colletotrichum cereale]